MSDTIISDIEAIRTSNNTYWMDILRIAMKHAPDETKLILKHINKNDTLISKRLNDLCQS